MALFGAAAAARRIFGGDIGDALGNQNTYEILQDTRIVLQERK